MKMQFFNREISWLEFNTRVLDQARDETTPLLERLKFLAIYGTNLDEFYMIRVAGLKELHNDGILKVEKDDLSAKEQLDVIENYLRKEKKEFELLYQELCIALQENGLKILHYQELDQQQKYKAKEYFLNHLYPVVVPIVIDSKNPFPHLNSLSINIAVELLDEALGDLSFGIVRIPKGLQRFVMIEKNIFISTENLVSTFMEEFFDGFKILHYLFFRITRNADIEIEEDEADDFIQLMSEGLKARKKGRIVRLELSGVEEEDLILRNFIQKQVGITQKDTFFYNTLLGVNSLWELVNHKSYSHLLLPNFIPRVLSPLRNQECIFESIAKQDIVLFHPYESFDPIIKFIYQASRDENVISISMTLYRVGKNSPIVEALIIAAQSKQVTALVELKARFDEENNLHWADALEKAGAHVIYGVPHLKVHGKIALVIRKEDEKLRGYLHIGSGNYNPITAKIYTDLSYFSANPKIVEDAIKLFHSFCIGKVYKTSLHSLMIAPMQIKEYLLSYIRQEMLYKQEGKIIFKANALVDREIIAELYKASSVGVKIFLIIRGICCLVPQMMGLSENIKVISLVGKYLEHARIYYFAHQKPIYFSSADLMPRNLERRVEIMVAITQTTLRQKILDILLIQLRDDINAYELQSSGRYFAKIKHECIDTQSLYEEYVNTLDSQNNA